MFQHDELDTGASGCAQADPHGDLTTELERELGKLVKQRHKTDFYILTRYPLAVRMAALHILCGGFRCAHCCFLRPGLAELDLSPSPTSLGLHVETIPVLDLA